MRVAHFFTHSREASSLLDGVQYEYLAAGSPQNFGTWVIILSRGTMGNEMDQLGPHTFESDTIVYLTIKKCSCQNYSLVLLK